MEIIITDTAYDTANDAASRISTFINNKPNSLLCFAAGETPLCVFTILIDLQKKNHVDLSSVYYVGLDEWEGLSQDTKGSCYQVMSDNFYTVAGIPSSRIKRWNGICVSPEDELNDVYQYIIAHGGIDLALLGIGMNGHIGFNEPFTGLPKKCIRVKLDKTTQSVSKKYFDIPTKVSYGLSIGAGELKNSQKIILMATGIHKADIVKSTIELPNDISIPSSLLTDHQNISLLLDKDAASKFSL